MGDVSTVAPFHPIAQHVEQSVVVRQSGSHGMAAIPRVLSGPGIVVEQFRRVAKVPPRLVAPVSGELPLRFCRQAIPRPVQAIGLQLHPRDNLVDAGVAHLLLRDAFPLTEPAAVLGRTEPVDVVDRAIERGAVVLGGGRVRAKPEKLLHRHLVGGDRKPVLQLHRVTPLLASITSRLVGQRSDPMHGRRGQNHHPLLLDGQ